MLCVTLNSSSLLIKFQAFIALCLLAVAAADNAPYRPAPYHPAPAPYHPAPAYKQPAYADAAPVYAYNYAVADDYSGANFGQNENRDGYKTYGEYRVALPDGRTQIVTYNVEDGYSGYVADVRYEGQATYPEYKPTYKAAPAYKPAPYHPAPVYHA